MNYEKPNFEEMELILEGPAFLDYSTPYGGEGTGWD